MANYKDDKKKKPLSPFAVGLLCVMLAVFVVQMLFPSNLSKIVSDKLENAAEITVTSTVGDDEAGESFTTDSQEEILEFIAWTDTKKARTRSLADSLNGQTKTATQYTFAVKCNDGTYTTFVIDSLGFIHKDAELYKVTGDTDEFIAELESELRTWTKSDAEEEDKE